MTARESLAALSFPQRQRLQYIESMALWEGAVARQRVCNLFGVSLNHITKDLRLYRQLLPNNLKYDPSLRIWRPSPSFRPAISSSSPEEYLGLLRLGLELAGGAGIPTLEGPLTADTIPAPRWPADAKPLRHVTRAVREGAGLRVQYQSMSHPVPDERILWPHALVYAGFRWHARAYDEKRKQFGDFVLARICDAAPHEGSAPVAIEQDHDWRQRQRADVVPNPKLSKAQQAVIAREYGMAKIADGWCWRVSMRRCLVRYFLLWHRLDNAAASDRVIARNLEELKPFSFANPDD